MVNSISFTFKSIKELFKLKLGNVFKGADGDILKSK